LKEFHPLLMVIGFFSVVLFLVTLSPSAEADPYAWPFFQPGDGEGGIDIKKEINNLLTSFVHSSLATEAGDGSQKEVALQFHTFSCTFIGNGPIDGFPSDDGGLNNGGMNFLADQGFADRLFPVGDKTQSGSVDAFNECANSQVQDRAFFVPSSEGTISHKKILTREDAAIVSTGNFTAGGTSFDHDAWLLLKDADEGGIPGIGSLFHEKLKDMWSGNNRIQGQSPD